MPKSTIAKPKSNAKSKSKSKPAKPAVESRAIDALKKLQSLGMPAESLAHHVAAIMTGKEIDAEHASNEAVYDMSFSSASMLFVMPEDTTAIKAKIKVNADAEVKTRLSDIAEAARAIGPAALLKLVPIRDDLHRHVAVLLPEYDHVNYTYKQGDSSSTLTGPDGLKFKTRRDGDDFW